MFCSHLLRQCCVAVVDNLPQVPPEKYEKLSGVVKKVISQAKVVIRDGEAS